MLHDLNIERLETKQGQMRPNELYEKRTLLLLDHVCLMPIINEVDDGRPQIAVADIVTETEDVDFRELIELLVMASAVIFCSREFGREERVDEGGLSQTQLALIRG